MVCGAGAAEGQWSSHEHHKDADEHQGGGSDGGSAADKQNSNFRITCYTCVNVSTNDECNRFAIDRPCPEGGGDYCLTLHVMDALDRERSVLVNKRCAPLDDCTGDSTGCTTANGQKERQREMLGMRSQMTTERSLRMDLEATLVLVKSEKETTEEQIEQKTLELKRLAEEIQGAGEKVRELEEHLESRRRAIQIAEESNKETANILLSELEEMREQNDNQNTINEIMLEENNRLMRELKAQERENLTVKDQIYSNKEIHTRDISDMKIKVETAKEEYDVDIQRVADLLYVALQEKEELALKYEEKSNDYLSLAKRLLSRLKTPTAAVCREIRHAVLPSITSAFLEEIYMLRILN